MRYPELVPDWVCTTPITLNVETEGLSEDGAPASIISVEAVCNWQDGGEAIFNEQQKVIHISGRAYFNGDILPQIPNITAGEAYIFGEKREIHRGYKRRNPDGTVNHTEILFK